MKLISRKLAASQLLQWHSFGKNAVGRFTFFRRYDQRHRPTNRQTDARRRLTRMHGIGNSHIYVAHNPVGGEALEWLSTLGCDHVPPEEFLNRIIPDVAKYKTDVKLSPPFLGGDRLQIDAQSGGFQISLYR